MATEKTVMHKSTTAVVEQRSSLLQLDGEIGCLWIDTAPRTAPVRLRAAHSGGEDLFVVITQACWKYRASPRADSPQHHT